MKSVPNYLQIASWSFVIGSILSEIVKNPTIVTTLSLAKGETNPFESAILVMRIAQSAQLLDFFLSSGNILSVLAQYLGRMVVAWIFMNEHTTPLFVTCCLVAWGTADIIRYSFYLKKSSITSFFRLEPILPSNLTEILLQIQRVLGALSDRCLRR